MKQKTREMGDNSFTLLCTDHIIPGYYIHLWAPHFKRGQYKPEREKKKVSTEDTDRQATTTAETVMILETIQFERGKIYTQGVSGRTRQLVTSYPQTMHTPR